MAANRARRETEYENEALRVALRREASVMNTRRSTCTCDCEWSGRSADGFSLPSDGMLAMLKLTPSRARPSRPTARSSATSSAWCRDELKVMRGQARGAGGERGCALRARMALKRITACNDETCRRAAHGDRRHGPRTGQG